MNNNIRDKIAAFTILEALVVIAMIGILVTIITSSINNFSKQLMVTSNISEEITMYRIMRSTIWNDLYNSDSVIVDNGNLKITKSGKDIEYEIEENILMRKSEGSIDKFIVQSDNILAIENDGNRFVELSFILGNQEMNIRYPLDGILKQKVQRYFKEEKLSGK